MVTSTLDYSTPRLFFSGEARYRSRSMIGGIGVLCALAVYCGVLALVIEAGDPVTTSIISGFGALCLFWGVYLIYGFVHDRRVVLRVTEDGVDYRGRLWTWQRITSFRGIRYPNGTIVMCRIKWGCFSYNRLLPLTPNLTNAEYAGVALAVGSFLQLQHPHINVTVHAESPSTV